MKRPFRVIPILLLRDGNLVKTRGFGRDVYIGDPLNAAKIFNDCEVDELIVLDISKRASLEGPDFDFLGELATECFMPVCYGGGLRTLAQAERLFALGFEKVSFNTAAIEKPDLIKEASGIFGASSIVVSIDVRKRLWGRYEVMKSGGAEGTGLKPDVHARHMVALGAGEILVTSIDQEGSQKGYDLDLIRLLVDSVSTPIIAHGGAARVEDLRTAIVDSGASAAAAGSLFVYHGRLNGVLINYPSRELLKDLFRGRV